MGTPKLSGEDIARSTIGSLEKESVNILGVRGSTPVWDIALGI